ncbi:MAG: hypothetical protein LBG45_09960 [Dysgonamonadaceae bacterium]|nr:hypothetical protein [Dysgonamonadaceae bacterium]
MFFGKWKLDFEHPTLRDYFQEEDVLPEWKMYRPMFRYFTSEREGKNQVISSSRSQVKRILLRWGSLRGGGNFLPVN